MAKRAKVGDVVEVKTPKGFGYLHYVGKHFRYGEMAVVSPHIFDKRPDDLKPIFEHGYVAFYPLGAAVAQHLVQIVGRTAVPADMPPKRLRRAGARSNRGVENWIIEEESGEVLKKMLTDEERQLPIVRIWNHEYLVHSLTTGWRPEMEG
jgi:hypothetical protein